MEEDNVIVLNHCRLTLLPSISKQSCHLSSVHLISCCHIAGVTVCTAAEMCSCRCCKSLIFTLYTWVFMWTHGKKSQGVRSGEHAAQTRGELRPIQHPGSVSLRQLCKKCGRVPSCYNTTKCRMLSANNWGHRNCSSMSSYDDDIIVASAKKNGS